MRDPIQSKFIRLYESIADVTLHASPMIGRSMGMSQEDVALLEEISTLASQARFKLENRLRPQPEEGTALYSFNAGTNSKGEPAVPLPTAEAPKSEPRGPSTAHKVKVTPRTDFVSTHKQWSLDPNLTKEDITRILGVEPSNSSCGKVKYEWDFFLDGKAAGIWDYYGAKWSAYGPKELFNAIGLTVVS